MAVDFPELRIIAGLGGWPWINETVALLRRHPILIATLPPIGPGTLRRTGRMDMLLQFGNTLLQDKVMVGLSAQGLWMSTTS